MNLRVAGATLLIGSLALMHAASQADEVKSGPDKRIGGPFQVKAITGGEQGKQLCYV